MDDLSFRCLAHSDVGGHFAMTLLPFLHGAFEFARCVADAQGVHRLPIQLLIERLELLADALAGFFHAAQMRLRARLLLPAESLHESLMFAVHLLKPFAQLVALCARGIRVEILALRT